MARQTPIEARQPFYGTGEPDWKRQYQEECEIVNRVWKALGIETYEQAGGKTIWELVAELKEKAWKYDQLCR